MRARRPRNVVLAAVALTLLFTAIGLTIGAVVWIDSYQPIAFASSYATPIGTRKVPGLPGGNVAFRRGQPFELGLEIVNRGRFAVRVLGVPIWHGHPWKARLLMSPSSYTHADNRRMRPFRPFDLQPGEHRFLDFKGVWACGHQRWFNGNTDAVTDFPVRYGFRWRKGTADIALPEVIAIHFPKGCG
jgi:hypothetical protein